jgi:hypothetical protein
MAGTIQNPMYACASSAPSKETDAILANSYAVVRETSDFDKEVKERVNARIQRLGAAIDHLWSRLDLLERARSELQELADSL